MTLDLHLITHDRDDPSRGCEMALPYSEDMFVLGRWDGVTRTTELALGVEEIYVIILDLEFNLLSLCSIN